MVNMVMRAAVEELGLTDITIAATSLGGAHDPIAAYIEQGKVTGIQTSGIRGRVGEVVSAGKLRTPAVIRSHGGRPRAIEAGEVHIDIAFLAAPTSDCMGNCRGVGGKSDCGSMGYAMTDARYAGHVVVVTDCLVDFPNMPASVEAIDVDAVVVVDSIGNPQKIASAAARISAIRSAHWLQAASHPSSRAAPSSSTSMVRPVVRSSRPRPRSTAQARRVAAVLPAAARAHMVPTVSLSTPGRSMAGFTRKNTPAKISPAARTSSQSHPHRPRHSRPRAGRAVRTRVIPQAARFPVPPERERARSHLPKAGRAASGSAAAIAAPDARASRSAACFSRFFMSSPSCFGLDWG